MMIDAPIPKPRCQFLVDMADSVASKETYFNIYAGKSSLVAFIPHLMLTPVKLALP